MAKPKSKLFEFVDAVSHTKDAGFMDDPTWEKEYIPFIVNRAFSYHRDSVLAANVMNERPHLQKNLQAWFYLNTLRARKRYASWHKNSVSDDVRVVSEYYGCSLHHATSLVSLHTSEQLLTMRTRMYKGGLSS
jgi:hypothetical protein